MNIFAHLTSHSPADNSNRRNKSGEVLEGRFTTEDVLGHADQGGEAVLVLVILASIAILSGVCKVHHLYKEYHIIGMKTQREEEVDTLMTRGAATPAAPS